MLAELRIRNFALIEQLTVQLGAGLNVLTGETGAGKSIVVGALSLLLGERASAEVVRAGAERASVEGVFEVDGRDDLLGWLEEHGIEAPEGVVILKREVAVEGRSRAWINGSPTTATLLAELGTVLVTLHGQHQHQTLLRRDEQRAILDAFGDHDELVGEIRRAYRKATELASQIATLEDRHRQAMQRADFLRFQVAEIEGTGVEDGEDERLEDESRRLSHAEELITLAGTLSQAIAAGDGSATERLGELRRGLEQLVRIDPSQRELSELFDSAWYALEELGSRLEDYLGLVEHDPMRLEEIRQRQDALYRLRAKYGPTAADVLRTLEEARAELSLIDEAEWEISALARRLEIATDEVTELASSLTLRRRTAAAAIEAEVNLVLPDLGMPGGRFEVTVASLDQIGPSGADEVEFLVSLNRGFEPRPLAQVASGGELSRVMLALKTILARVDAVPTLIFDEVDAGIGGRVALQVGEKMRQVAGSHQVLAITHLPQIASRAHRHLLVRKDDAAEKTAALVTTLDTTGRTHEIARMLGGDPESGASLAHARELLEKGREVDAANTAT